MRTSANASIWRSRRAAKTGHFLADGGGRGRLAMRARQHRDCGVLASEPARRLGQIPHRGQKHLRARVGEHHRVGEVVDILRRAREVDAFTCAGQLGRIRNPFPDEVLDGLDVMIRLALDDFHPPRIVEREAAHDAVEEALRLLAQRVRGRRTPGASPVPAASAPRLRPGIERGHTRSRFPVARRSWSRIDRRPARLQSARTAPSLPRRYRCLG